MKNKKILISVLTILVLMIALISESYAANSFSATLTPNSTRVSKGSEVKVTVKLSSIKLDDGGGLNTITATVKYDSDVLTISNSDVKGLNDWNPTFNSNNGKISLVRQDEVNEDQEIVTLTFKVAENTSSTSTTISLTDVQGANSSLDEEVTISNQISTTITLSGSLTSPSASTSTSPSTSASESPSTSPSASTSTEPSQSTSASASTSASPSSSASSSSTPSGTTTTTEEDMPNTGLGINYILPLVLVIGAIAVVSFVNYKKIGKLN